MNAHDAVGPGGEELVVLVVVRHERVFGPGHRGPDESTPTLWRWTLDLTNRTVRTEQLHDDRRAMACAAAVGQFRADAQKSARRQQAAGNANELADRAVVATDARQYLAQHAVGESVHRRQQYFSQGSSRRLQSRDSTCEAPAAAGD